MNAKYYRPDGTPHSDAFNFYANRISSCPLYGLVAGRNILIVIHRCAFMDSELSYDEYCLICERIMKCDRKLMEVNYNEGWN